MKIAFVSTFNGSAWAACEELWTAGAKAAVDAGHTVSASVVNTLLDHPRHAALRAAGVTYSGRRPFNPGRISRKIHRYYNWHKPVLADRPDVVLISQGSVVDWTITGALTKFLPALWAARIPYVVLSHGNLEGGVASRAVREEARTVYGRAAKTCFVSEGSRRITERLIGAAIPNARVLRNPVSLASPAVQPWPAGDTARFATVSRLDAHVKGLDVLLEAFGPAGADRADPPWKGRDWELRIYGDGPDRDYLDELVALYGLGGRVRFPGHVTDIAGLWRDNHVLLMPSRSEAMGISLMEAMMCGRPVVVTDVGGMPEWVEDGRTGFVAPAPQAGALAATLERAWAARDRWPEIGRAAHDAAMRLWDPNPGKALLDVLVAAAGTP